MSQLFIPSIGDRFSLVRPWQFNLYLEWRNVEFGKVHGLLPPSHDYYDGYIEDPITKRRVLKKLPFTMESGTVVECDRIYIKSTSKQAKSIDDNYDSITWKVVINNKPVKSQRFWVKLAECNGMEFDPYLVSKYQDRKKV